MSHYRGDPPGLARPPTPYPFLPDPSWGTIKTPRSDRHPPYEKQSIRTTERIVYQPPRIHKQLLNRNHLAIPWPSEVPNAETDKRHGRSTTQLVERRRVAIGAEDKDIQRQILAQNAKIARRPRPRQAGIPGRADKRRVRFQLPGQGKETRHREADLVGSLEQLQLEDFRPASARCSSCRQPLRCRECGLIVFADLP